MTLDQALNYIHGQYHKAQPGLQRIAELMTKLGNPQKKTEMYPYCRHQRQGQYRCHDSLHAHQRGL